MMVGCQLPSKLQQSTPTSVFGCLNLKSHSSDLSRLSAECWRAEVTEAMLRAVLAAQPGAATAAAPAAKAAIAASQAGALRSSAPAKTNCSPTHHEPLHKRKRPAAAPAQPEDIAVIRMPAWKPSQHLTRLQVAKAQHLAWSHLQTM